MEPRQEVQRGPLDLALDEFSDDLDAMIAGHSSRLPHFILPAMLFAFALFALLAR